jgi:hypothetical protein
MYRCKAFVVGFICTFKAILELADDLFKGNVVSYLPTFRISQDFIETLFSKIRRMGGHNTNPTAVLFKSALRSLLTKQAINSSEAANCLDVQSSSGVFSLEWSKRRAPVPNADAELSDELINKLKILSSANTGSATNIYHENILRYVAGYIVRSTQGKVNCTTCADVLVDSCSTVGLKDHTYNRLTGSWHLFNVKQLGGLVAASEPVYQILVRCERLIRVYLNQHLMAKARPDKTLLALFNRSIYEDRPARHFTHRCELAEGLTDHCQQLTQAIAEKYFDMRLKHYSRHFNKNVIEAGKGSDRTRLSRLVIFNHL